MLNRKIPKSRIKKIGLASFLILINVIAFSIIPSFSTFKFQILSFSIDQRKDYYRIDSPISFTWQLSGTPSKALLIGGDGKVQNIKQKIEETGLLQGTVNHSYSLQGKYSPTLLVWDMYGKQYSQSLDVVVQNDILNFDIEFYYNYSLTTPEEKAFENQEVIISVENIMGQTGYKNENLSYLFDFSDSQMITDTPITSYTWNNKGMYPVSVSIIDSHGTLSQQTEFIEIINSPPHAEFFFRSSFYSLRVGDGIDVSASLSYDSPNDQNSLQYIWNWGDNSKSWGKLASHRYSASGLYTILLKVIDNDGATDTFLRIVHIYDSASHRLLQGESESSSDTMDPLVTIGMIPPKVYEDQVVQFTPEIDLNNRSITDFSFFWQFGDGSYSYERAPTHSWIRADVYSLTLQVSDTEGNVYQRQKYVSIMEKDPEILGPFSFTGIEGQALTLDVEAYDSLDDQPRLQYKWLDEKGQIFSTEKKPVVILDDGKYDYTFKVVDPSGPVAAQEIHITILPRSPELFVGNYMYHGSPGNRRDGNDNTGSIELRAFYIDSTFDISAIRCNWVIKSKNNVYSIPGQIQDGYSKINFKCTETTIYQGQVHAADPSGNTKTTAFQIFSFIDSSRNGVSDEFEYMQDLLASNVQDSTMDTDGDHIPDAYEEEILNSYSYEVDSDGDGLWDGYDSSGIGELTLGTSPLKIDTDDDSLPDNIEYSGWEITVNYFENRSTFYVNSDPLSFDSDDDGFSDLEEFNAKTNPKSRDTDGDRLMDSQDPYPTTWDEDSDLLSDYKELEYGTDMSNSDTDGDGIKDGEELMGYGLLNYRTNPISADTDHDFALDNAELLNYKVKLEDEYGQNKRANLTEPVSLLFPHYFEQAASAQITFALSFGEYGEDASQTYGIQDEDIPIIQVKITKLGDNIVLNESIIRDRRHVSKVVDVSEIMNNSTLGLNYYGEYEIHVSEMGSNNAPSCLLERFELDIFRSLSPLDDDYDNDGIMDGVEMNLLVRGTKKIDIKDFYNFSSESNLLGGGVNEFVLEIPDIGRVYDANIKLKIESQDTLLGSGRMKIELIRKDFNLSIESLHIINRYIGFDVNGRIDYDFSFDLTPWLEFGRYKEYYAEFVLKINIEDSNPNDTFYISEYYIEVDTFIPATSSDSQAYITNPALEDSDGDGWSDSREIFTTGTNPLNKDMDQDGAWDPHDRDPFRNLFIRIRPISALFNHNYEMWQDPPMLEIIIEYNVNDLLDPDFSEDTSNIGFCTVPQEAITNGNSNGNFQKAWWTEGEEYFYYYFDINDDITIQSNLISFYFQMWELRSLGDIDIYGGEWLQEIYSINTVGHSDLLRVSRNGDVIYCDIETIATERANTIAIYDPNSTNTLFTGHYQEEERMNVIQLHITDDGHYPATMSFLHELEGTSLGEWIDDDGWTDLSDSGQTATIVNELDGHNQVLQLHDSHGSRKAAMYHQWGPNYQNGTVELWVRMSSNTDIADLIIRDAIDTNSIYFRFDNDGYMKYLEGSSSRPIMPYQPNTWYHLKFRWDCRRFPPTEERGYVWFLSIDGVRTDSGYGYNFLGNPNVMNGLIIRTHDGSVDYDLYIDAIAYSFDREYDIGDNRYASNCAGTPFNPGLNVIVIPTSLFDKTLLNSYFQNEQLYMTPLYSSKPGLFEFYSIDREGNTVEIQTSETDFVFVRYDLDAQKAMEILNSLLTCAINQSTDENDNTITDLATVYEYISTKLNGTNVVKMNLPDTILTFIPWLTNFQNSEYGRAPRTFNFFQLLTYILLTLIAPPLGLFLLVSLTIYGFAVIFDRIAKAIGLALLTFLANLLWIIIRTALLIFIFIMLAIEVLAVVPMFLALGVGLAVFGALMGMEVIFGVNAIPLYGVNTKIGYVEMDIQGKNFELKATIRWIYWEFFDLYIPYIDTELNFDPESLIDFSPQDPSTSSTILTCGYEQVGEFTFDFHSIYWDFPFNTRPAYVGVNLISPSENTFSIPMEISPTGHKSIEYWVGRRDWRTRENYTYDPITQSFVPPNWYRGVRFNVSIDFKNNEFLAEENLTGQWYYQFYAKADRDNACDVYWPWQEYAIGPYFNETGSPLQETNTSSLLYSELYPDPGNENQLFNFSVWWADYEDNSVPETVSLMLELPDGTINTYNMENSSSYVADYSRVSNYGNVTFTEFKRVLNLSEYVFNETVLFKHYFQALHANGFVETLTDFKYVDELGDEILSGNESDYINATEVDIWFEGPLVFPYFNERPLIKKWEVQDLTNNRYLRKFGYGDRIWEEQELVFWLYVDDADRSNDTYFTPQCYNDEYPQVTLTNSREPEKTMMLNDFTWWGYDDTLQADVFWVVIGADEIGAGLWDFEFAVVDDHDNSYNLSKEMLPKIWIVGSANAIFDKMRKSMTIFGYYPALSFTAFAGAAQGGGTSTGVVATILALGAAIGFSGMLINEINSLFKNSNAGGLLGLGTGLIAIAACFNIGLLFKVNMFASRSIIFTSILEIIFLTGGLFSFGKENFSLMDFLSSAGDIFGIMGISIAMGVAVNGIGSDTLNAGESFNAGKWIKSIVKLYSIALLLIGVICFVLAGNKNGANSNITY